MQLLRQGWTERYRIEGNNDTHQRSMKKICVGSRVSQDESAKLEFHQGLNYPITTKNSTACKILRIALVGKASSVAHENMILWRTGGAPQKLRHKNRVSVAHRTMRHRIKVFCGAYDPAAPQK
jgi:hypothetical protein